jgi:hypothetical protein
LSGARAHVGLYDGGDYYYYYDDDDDGCKTGCRPEYWHVTLPNRAKVTVGPSSERASMSVRVAIATEQLDERIHANSANLTCIDDVPDGPALLPLAVDDKLRLEARPRRLDLGLAPCLLPGAAVPFGAIN